MSSEILGRLHSSILALDMDATLAVVRTILEEEGSAGPQRAVDAITDALAVVGQRFQEGEWFLGELVYASEITKAAMGLLSPPLSRDAKRVLGTIVVGTVTGDLHDLGKDIFGNYAKGAGFEVIDLGVDVSAQGFADAAERHRPLALGMSCLLTICAARIPEVIGELNRRGLREHLKVIVGGAALTDAFARRAGADAFAPDAVTGTQIIKGWGER
jgi:methanogenic corrinoid protein MtbC1